jgi:hypothetical protein
MAVRSGRLCLEHTPSPVIVAPDRTAGMSIPGAMVGCNFLSNTTTEGCEGASMEGWL